MLSIHESSSPLSPDLECGDVVAAVPVSRKVKWPKIELAVTALLLAAADGVDVPSGIDVGGFGEGDGWHCVITKNTSPVLAGQPVELPAIRRKPTIALLSMVCTILCSTH